MNCKTIPRQKMRLAFGRTVIRLRRKRGIAQEKLALEAGIDRGYMSGLERGRHSPTLDTIHKVLCGLGSNYTEFGDELERSLSRN